jgi:hypothetical protein
VTTRLNGSGILDRFNKPNQWNSLTFHWGSNPRPFVENVYM